MTPRESLELAGGTGEITDEDRRAFKRAELRQMQRLMGEMAAPDPDDEPDPPRRSGCLSVLPWLALLLAIALGIVVSAPRTAPDLSAQSGAPHAEVQGEPAPGVATRLPVAGRPVTKAPWEPLSVAALEETRQASPAEFDLATGSARLGGGAPTPTGSVGTALLGGWISWADPDLGGDYLATRFPRGTLVRLCTPNRCIVRRSNDFGPSAKIDPPRIADLAVLDWESLCGLPRARGVCRGTVEAIGEIALPPTDTAP